MRHTVAVTPKGLSSPKFGVSTKSQLGVKGAGSLNSVKQRPGKKASKNQKTAFSCGVLIDGLVPKGGLEPPRVTSHAPQTCASASSATSARLLGIITRIEIIKSTNDFASWVRVPLYLSPPIRSPTLSFDSKLPLSRQPE